MDLENISSAQKTVICAQSGFSRYCETIVVVSVTSTLNYIYQRTGNEETTECIKWPKPYFWPFLCEKPSRNPLCTYTCVPRRTSPWSVKYYRLQCCAVHIDLPYILTYHALNGKVLKIVYQEISTEHIRVIADHIEYRYKNWVTGDHQGVKGDPTE